MSRLRGIWSLVLVSGLLAVGVSERLEAQESRRRVHVPDAESALAESLVRFDPAADDVKRATDSAAHLHRGEPCLTAFLQRVRRFSPEWSEQEREHVRSLSPELELAVAGSAERARSRFVGAKAVSMLPDYDTLTESVEGAACIVHYTFTGEDAVPDQAYVDQIRKWIDKAANKMGRAFRSPIHEQADDGIDKLHVYVNKIQADAQLGEVLGFVDFVQEVEGDATGKQRTVYMALSNNMNGLKPPGATLEQTIKSTCFHEYMHCIQAAYNHELKRWALEGMATWSEARFAKVDKGIQAFFESDSVFTQPELPLWHETVRMYSTAAFFLYLDRTFGRQGGMQTFLEKSATEDDPLAIFNAMAIERGNTFEELFLSYLVDLHSKNLKGVRKSIIPNMALADLNATYGYEKTGQVMRTGVQVYEMDPDSSLPVTFLFARVTADGPDSSPVGVLRHGIKANGKKGKRLALSRVSWSNVEKFGRGAPAAVLVTDVRYAGMDDSPSPFQVEVFAPYINVTRVSPPPNAIGPFDAADIEVTYDLLGTPQGMATFGVAIYVKSKAPGQDPSESFLFPNWTVGRDQTAIIQYDPFGLPPPKGTHKIKYIARTPNDSYGGEHTRTKFKAKVKVN